ncbi:hypothetical protein ACFX10_044667 [Malus domestica]
MNFASLSVLDLSYNDFNSTLPPWLFSLTKLVTLEMHSTNLHRALPETFGSLTSLRMLDLSENSNIEGQFPRCLGTLCSLQTGSVPKSIGDLNSLEELYISHNQMSGIISESLGQPSSLTTLDISENTWEGSITEAHFMKLGSLREVEIYNTSPNISLVFDISSDWIAPFRLRYLNIRSCQPDTIPEWFWQLDFQLDQLDVAYNQLSGRVPNSLRFIEPAMLI